VSDVSNDILNYLQYVNMCAGAKYHKANDAVRVILRDGSLRTLSTPSSVTELSEEGQEMCQYVSEVSEVLSYLLFSIL